MAYLSSGIVLMAFFTVFGGVLCEGRSSRLRSHLQTEDRSEQEGSCFQAFEKCSKSKKCREALRGLDQRCKVISGHCGAAMVDLTRCGQIMDHIFSFGFPDKRCSCAHDSKGCSNMLNKVYSNPCFASIKHLRKNGLFPKEINAYDKVSRIKVTTTQSPLTTVLMNAKYVQPDDEESELALFEEVFGDRNVAKKSLSRVPKTVPFVEDNKVLRTSQGKPKPQNNPREEVTVNPPLKVEQTRQFQKQHDVNVAERLKFSDQREDRDNVQMRKSPEEPPRETDGPVEGLTKEENTDFRSIAIILAILLGILILGATIFLLWARINTSYFYTSAKLVQDRRDDEEIRPKAPFSPVMSNDDAV